MKRAASSALKYGLIAIVVVPVAVVLMRVLVLFLGKGTTSNLPLLFISVVAIFAAVFLLSFTLLLSMHAIRAWQMFRRQTNSAILVPSSDAARRRIQKALREELPQVVAEIHAQSQNVRERGLLEHVGWAQMEQTVHEVLNELRHEAQEKGQTIHVDLHRVDDVQIRQPLLREIFYRLLRNAIEWSTVGSLIQVLLDESDPDVVLDVVSQGPAIQRKDFENMFKAHAETSQLLVKMVAPNTEIPGEVQNVFRARFGRA